MTIDEALKAVDPKSFEFESILSECKGKLDQQSDVMKVCMVFYQSLAQTSALGQPVSPLFATFFAAVFTAGMEYQKRLKPLTDELASIAQSLEVDPSCNFSKRSCWTCDCGDCRDWRELQEKK